MSLAEKHAKVLELPRPHCAVGPGGFEPSGIGRIAGDRRATVAVVETVHGVRLAVPARIVVRLSGAGILDRVTVRGVSEHVAGVVRDDVEDHIDALLVGGVDEVAEVLARPEMWVDVEEVLDAVTVVARRLECDLAKDRAHPERGDAETLEIPELALQSLQGAALPYAAGLEPSIVVDASGVRAV